MQLVYCLIKVAGITKDKVDGSLNNILARSRSVFEKDNNIFKNKDQNRSGVHRRVTELVAYE